MAEQDLEVQPKPATNRAETTLCIPQQAEVHVTIYAVDEAKVVDIYSGALERGRYAVPVTLANLTAGTYLIELTAGRTQLSCRLVVR